MKNCVVDHFAVEIADIFEIVYNMHSTKRCFVECIGENNMKKFALVAIVILLSVSTVFASAYGASKKDALSIGLNLGSNNGVVVDYGMGKFDLEAIVGFSLFNKNMDVEIAANYALFDIADMADFAGYMPFTVGAEGVISTNFKDFGVGATVPMKLAYTFPKVPVTLYFRVAPGVMFSIAPEWDVNLYVPVSLGATYNF